MSKNGGFTLIELAMVLLIIAIIASIGIPSLMRSRMAANEGAAVATMRTISSAQVQFQAAAILPFPSGMGRYSPDLTTLGAQVPSFIDTILAVGNKEGFIFTTIGGGVDGGPTFMAHATPLALAASGNRSFFINDSGLITFIAGAGPAGPGDSPVQ